MTTPKPTSHKSRLREEKRKKLGQALRANLSKRKEQTRTRATPAPKTSNSQ